MLPTKTVLAKRLRGRDTFCGLYSQYDEKPLHLFKFCSISKALEFSRLWGICFDAIDGDTSKEMIKLLCVNASGIGHTLKLLIVTCLWYLV